MVALSTGSTGNKHAKKNGTGDGDLIIVEKFMERLIAAEKGEPLKDDNLDDPQPLHHEVNYVIRTWLDHRKHGTYPRPGGYDEQDPDLMEDWHTLTLICVRVENGITSYIDFPAEAPDVSEQLGA